MPLNKSFTIEKNPPEIDIYTLSSGTIDEGKGVTISAHITIRGEEFEEGTIVTLELRDKSGAVKDIVFLPVLEFISYEYKPEVKPGMYVLALLLNSGESSSSSITLSTITTSINGAKVCGNVK